MTFEFKPQHDFDLHIALEVDRPTLEDMHAKGLAVGMETRGVSHHGFIDSIYFRDPNDSVIELTCKREGHDALMDPARDDAREILARWDQAKAQAGASKRAQRAGGCAALRPDPPPAEPAVSRQLASFSCTRPRPAPTGW